MSMLLFSVLSYVLSGGALCMELLTPQVHFYVLLYLFRPFISLQMCPEIIYESRSKPSRVPFTLPSTSTLVCVPQIVV